MTCTERTVACTERPVTRTERPVAPTGCPVARTGRPMPRTGRPVAHTHRGSLATAGGFEETLLDDGDMNMFKILLELKKQGFNGCINPDHIPAIHGDSPSAHQGLAYSIGYIKALYAALAVEE